MHEDRFAADVAAVPARQRTVKRRERARVPAPLALVESGRKLPFPAAAPCPRLKCASAENPTAARWPRGSSQFAALISQVALRDNTEIVVCLGRGRARAR